MGVLQSSSLLSLFSLCLQFYCQFVPICVHGRPIARLLSDVLVNLLSKGCSCLRLFELGRCGYLACVPTPPMPQCPALILVLAAWVRSAC